MAFSLPEVDMAPLGAHAPLQVAIIQFTYLPKLALEEPTRVLPLQDLLALGNTPFRLVEEGVMQSLSFSFGPGGVQQAAPSTPEKVWRFKSSDDTCALDINRTSLSFEIAAYDSYESLRARVDAALLSFSEVFGDGTVVTRVGMRYVNRVELDGPPANRINTRLLSPVGTELGDALEASLNQLLFVEENAKIRIIHGLTEPAAYTLDYDCFDETERGFDREDLLAVVDDFHDKIDRLFAWSLAETFLAELNAELAQ